MSQQKQREVGRKYNVKLRSRNYRYLESWTLEDPLYNHLANKAGGVGPSNGSEGC
jgi:hypothetical protein